ncbi:MAG: metalloregulator ArsR/SmtB family transcription factor [Herpetosiphonaceae bacterium]|nr:metalloregulator ArsR/SmtB family transcription factor [Herpetosiphonaceae bacterium]
MLADVGAIPGPDVLAFFKVLADETRLAIVRLLTLSDLRVGELVNAVQQPQNAVSYHLKQLRRLGLLRDRRSNRDGRDVYYSVDLERLHALYMEAGAAIHPGLTVPATEPASLAALERPLRILFLCTHNRARSQLAEGIARSLAGDQVAVVSAGSEPSAVHPLTIELLRDLGIDGSDLASKSLQLFAEEEFDYIITTCDRVREECPTFPGDPRQIHWSFADPLEVTGGLDRQRLAFRTTARELVTRLEYLLSLPHPVTGQRLMLRIFPPQLPGPR